MSGRVAVISAVVATVVASVLVAVGAATLLRPHTPSTVIQSDDAVSSQQVPPRPDCPAVDLGGVDLECLGGVTSDAEGSSDVVVANVWAWWCGPCRDELPHLQAFADAHPEYTVVGVHADKLPARGAAFLDEIGVGLPSFSDTDNIFAGTLGLPAVVPVTAVFVDGELVAQYAVAFTSADEINDAVEKAVVS